MPGLPRISVVIPCLDEAESIGACVEAAQALVQRRGGGEVLVVDNGSTDSSRELAAAAGATVVPETERGYGAALLAGFAAASGDYIVMADGDLTYDFGDADALLDELDAGADMVLGNRMDNIDRHAMPWLHRYVGNPILSGVLNAWFDAGVTDAHCGMRAFRRSLLPRLALRGTGMELASEMVIRAAKAGAVLREVPIRYHNRVGRSKLSTFRDGWRHLRLLLVHAPLYLFLIPGAVLSGVGALLAASALSEVEVFGRAWHVHALVAGCMLMIAGVQVLALGACARTYGVYFLDEHSDWFDRMRRRWRLEHGLLLGGGILLAGIGILVGILVAWARRDFAELSEERLAVVASTMVVIGLQVLFASFLLSIIGLRRPR